MAEGDNACERKGEKEQREPQADTQVTFGAILGELLSKEVS